MIKAAIDRVLELGKPEQKEIDGRQYFLSGSGEVTAIKPPRPELVGLHTLTGVVDFIKDYREHGDAKDQPLLVHVAGPGEVWVLTQIDGPWQTRDVLADATSITEPFHFDTQLSIEDMIIQLNSRFVVDENCEKILKILSNIEDSDKLQLKDNGITQNIVAMVGLGQRGRLDLPSPIPLRPYRTFLEVEQPESNYIFRLSGGKREGSEIYAALYSAGGGMWKMDAIHACVDWLASKLVGDDYKPIPGVSIIS